MVFIGMAPVALAQGPRIEEAEMVVNGISRKGQRATLQLDREVVERAWKIYLKDQSGTRVSGVPVWPFSKAKAPKGIYTIEKGKIDTISSSPVNIVSKVEGGQDSTTVWWSLEVGGKNLNQGDTPKEWERTAGLLQQFARNLYLEDVQSEVDYAEDVVVYSKAEAERMARSASKIQAKIDKKQEEKRTMEAALASKTKELERLNQDMQENLNRQEIALAAKERELDEMNKKLQRWLIRQEVAQQEMEIMRQTVEVVKAKISRMI
ncbi:hypothetical protein [Rufibacter hautae]|uniref:DNA repair ATPase n=1 Tax=Rufibacter hautae TaxID=2595005 RepID=A0A5B6TB86_9BACT|nr:hypothetical protein [Rufibacter hautae]KAA3437737.1 hypothetical protein FOA19_10570 [Rufibacter hautae]